MRFLKQRGDLLQHGIDEEVIKQLKAPDSGYDGAFIRIKRSNNMFQAAAILLTAIVIAWHHGRNLLVFDSAYCSSLYGGILLIATTIDANENTVVLTWAIVPTKSTE